MTPRMRPIGVARLQQVITESPNHTTENIMPGLEPRDLKRHRPAALKHHAKRAADPTLAKTSCSAGFNARPLTRRPSWFLFNFSRASAKQSRIGLSGLSPRLA